MKEIKVSAKIENVSIVTDFVNEELEKNDASMKSVMQIDIAIDEIFSNIANYAYDEIEGEAVISIDITENREAVLSFKDSGKYYNPLEKEDPDVTLSADERDIGGLGIFLVKKSMDNIDYEYKNNCNILTIKKSIC